MADYKMSTQDGVVRTSDNTFIARDKNSADWQTFLAWQAAGGVLDPADPVPVKYEWYIDIGPFFDRFGSAKMNVLTSTNATAKAIVTDVSIRKWIDLKHPSVVGGINALIAVGVPGVDATLRDTILNTPVTDDERGALVKLYFS